MKYSKNEPSQFLSIQAQDFIEDRRTGGIELRKGQFLSIQAQDFIEESQAWSGHYCSRYS